MNTDVENPDTKHGPNEDETKSEGQVPPPLQDAGWLTGYKIMRCLHGFKTSGYILMFVIALSFAPPEIYGTPFTGGLAITLNTFFCGLAVFHFITFFCLDYLEYLGVITTKYPDRFKSYCVSSYSMIMMSGVLVITLCILLYLEVHNAAAALFYLVIVVSQAVDLLLLSLLMGTLTYMH